MMTCSQADKSKLAQLQEAMAALTASFSDFKAGQPTPKTLRFTASVNGHPVYVLIDASSSHNILQPRIANFLHLPVQPIDSFSVIMGNGAHLECFGLCPGVPLLILTHTFHTPFYLLYIQGADVVLGVQWLQTIGPFISDYTIPEMQFYYGDSPVTL